MNNRFSSNILFYRSAKVQTVQGSFIAYVQVNVFKSVA